MALTIRDKQTIEDLDKLKIVFNLWSKSRTIKHLCKLYLDKLWQ